MSSESVKREEKSGYTWQVISVPVLFFPAVTESASKDVNYLI